MSSKPLLLEGIAGAASDHAEELRALRRENQRLEDEVRDVRNDLDRARADKERLERSLRALRQQLSPLHRALRAIFGEIELAVGEEEFSASSTATAPQAQGVDPRWESYKQNFPGAPARVIDALLSHREMTITQLSALLKAHYDTVKGAVAKLVKAGAVSRQGGVCQLNR